MTGAMRALRPFDRASKIAVEEAYGAANPTESWWIGLCREALQERCAGEQARMRNSRFGRVDGLMTSKDYGRAAREWRKPQKRKTEDAGHGDDIGVS